MRQLPNAPTLADEILDDRQKTHGDFGEVAVIAQAIKTIIRGHAQLLSLDQREALDMIATKIARILSGDPEEPDHWRDIMGYAALALRGIEDGGVKE
jgi:hypothetical protein